MNKKISTLFILVFAIVLTSCVGSTPSSNEVENLAIVEKYQEALKNFDYETMVSLLADDYVSYGPSLADSMGRDDLMINWKYNMEHLYDKLEYKGVQNVAITNLKDGEPLEWVSSWGKLLIKYKESGNEAVIWSNTTYNIVDGKIKKSIIFFNEADALRQLGYKYTYTNPNPIK